MDPEEEIETPTDEQQPEELPPPEEGFEYQLGEDGNVEYDENDEPIVIQSVSPTDETPPETPPVDDDQPAQVYLPQGEGPAKARLKEMLDPEVFASVQAYVQEETSRAMQTFGVTQASFTAAAARHPEVFRKYGGKIQMALAMFPEQDRHTAKSVDIAITLATIEDKAGTPAFAKELLKIAQQLNGGTTGAAAARPPKEPIPAVNRPPSPSSGVRSQAVSRRDSTLKLIMKDGGYTKAEAEELMKGGR